MFWRTSLLLHIVILSSPFIAVALGGQVSTTLLSLSMYVDEENSFLLQFLRRKIGNNWWDAIGGMLLGLKTVFPDCEASGSMNQSRQL